MYGGGSDIVADLVQSRSNDWCYEVETDDEEVEKVHRSGATKR